MVEEVDSPARAPWELLTVAPRLSLPTTSCAQARSVAPESGPQGRARVGKANLDTEEEVLCQIGGSLLLFALFTYASDAGVV